LVNGSDVSKEGVVFIIKGQVGALEDEGNAFLRKVGNHSSNGVASHPSRQESSNVVRIV
jgi:hypothetical protein